MNFIKIGCCLLALLLGILRAYWFCCFVFAFSLGAVECVIFESVPQQQIEHQQQGKQFDHFPIHPIILKSNTLFTLYVCIADL